VIELLTAVKKSKVFPLPAEDAPSETDPVLFKNTFPAVLDKSVLAVVKTRAASEPMSPVPVPTTPSLKSTVFATNEPDTALIPPVPAPLSLELRLIELMMPAAAATPPLIVMRPFPLASAVVLRLKVCAFPEDDAVNVTEPELLRNTFPAVFAAKFGVAVNMRALTVPMLPLPVPLAPSFKVTVVAVRRPVASSIPPLPTPLSVEVKFMVEMIPDAA
jgi:hypothetical protein